VVTSPAATVQYASGPRRPRTEADWTDAADRRLTPYERSKTGAEKPAWALVDGAHRHHQLTSIIPATMLGPWPAVLLGPGHTAHARGHAGLPRLGFSFVDVRDIAALQVTAMFAPQAAGQRYLATGPFLWLSEVAAILRHSLGPAAAKVPRRVVPDPVIKILSRFDPA
jgi:dihydroflavonol-4-reductase